MIVSVAPEFAHQMIKSVCQTRDDFAHASEYRDRPDQLYVSHAYGTISLFPYPQFTSFPKGGVETGMEFSSLRSLGQYPKFEVITGTFVRVSACAHLDNNTELLGYGLLPL